MHKIMKGALTFRRHVFSAYRDLFRRLAETQRPEALFVTCSDARIVPNLITTADPGDLFVVRNVGNIVPEADVDSAEGAALEFAVGVLGVQDIVVCGHSSCGAMKAALDGTPPGARHLTEWLRHSDSALDLHRRLYTKGDGGPDLLAQLNVLVQLKHIKTHPLVRQRLDEGKLHLHAWFFEIDSAQLHTYDPDEEQFVPLREQDALADAGA